jgi:hypothetical protein
MSFSKKIGAKQRTKSSNIEPGLFLGIYDENDKLIG